MHMKIRHASHRYGMVLQRSLLTQLSKGLRSHSLTYRIFYLDSLTHCLIVTDSLPDSLTD